MATSANRFIQDQNLSSIYNGVTPSGKTNVAKPVKKGAGLGGRRALNDISNARNTNVPQAKKQNPANTIAIERDPSAGRAFSKAPEKGKLGGRKALGDLTNSVKPASQQAPKTGRKLGTVSENVPSCMADERFLHNHHECIKAQTKAPDIDFFLKSTGLNKSILASRGFPSPTKKYDGYTSHVEMEELPDLLFTDEVDWCKKSELLGYFSPACRSPKSPKLSHTSWGEDSVCDLMVIASP